MSESETQTAETPSSKSRFSGNWYKYFSLIQLLLSLVLVLAALAWLLWAPDAVNETTDSLASKTQIRPTVEASGYGKLTIDTKSPLGKRLPILELKSVLVTEPLLHVTGRVIASRRPGEGEKKDYWQFNSGELLNDFSAWEKAVADVVFNQSQLVQIRELCRSKEEALANAITRFEKLVKSGSESEKDLIGQRSVLLQTQIQDRKDIYQAELAISIAEREARTLSLQLLQSGLDPQQLENATSDMDIVTAEVPEAMIERVAIGQMCTADFFGIAESIFEGKLTSISPILSAEQHTLRVLFVVHDPLDRLRPGMFAKIGIGTDPRQVIKIPADSVIHVGRNDLVMVVDEQEDDSEQSLDRLAVRIEQVVVSDLMNGQVNVVKGLNVGDRIIANNAILLQPVVILSMRLTKDSLKKSEKSSASIGVGALP